MDKLKEFEDTAYTLDLSVKSAHLDGGMLETYGADGVTVWGYSNNHKAKRKLWTVTDSENSDDLIISAGWHFFNRVCYVVTNEPWNSDDECYIWMSSDADFEFAQTNDACPMCGSEDHEGTGVEFNSGSINASWQCNKCKCEFTQEFNLAGCTINKKGEL